jgi:hypothetical protein
MLASVRSQYRAKLQESPGPNDVLIKFIAFIFLMDHSRSAHFPWAPRSVGYSQCFF